MKFVLSIFDNNNDYVASFSKTNHSLFVSTTTGTKIDYHLEYVLEHLCSMVRDQVINPDGFEDE